MAFIDLISSKTPDFHELNLSRNICVADSDKSCLEKQLQLIDTNLGSFYDKLSKTIYRNDKHWKSNKWQEMSTQDLFHVSYWNLNPALSSQQHDAELVCFCSIMPCEESIIPDQTSKILYLYEIHVSPNWQSKGLGKSIIHSLKSDLCPAAHLAGIELTVFSSNHHALAFYEKNEFLPSHDSPRDKYRRTRNGSKTIRPDYYIMCYVLP